MKKTLLLTTILFILLGLYLVYNYMKQPITAIKKLNNQNTMIHPAVDFRGPSSSPSVRGPTSLPPK